MPNLEGQPTPQPGPQYGDQLSPWEFDRRIKRLEDNLITGEYAIGRFDHLTKRIEKLEELVGELIDDKTHTHRTMGGH